MTPTLIGVCQAWLGDQARDCGATDDVHLYPSGVRCPAHSPRAVREASGEQPFQRAVEYGLSSNPSRRGGGTRPVKP